MLLTRFINTSVALLFSGGILTAPAAIAQTETDLDNPSLSIKESEVYSISVKPNDTNSATSYKLRVFADEQESKVVASATRPMDGQVVDLEIYDIDKDGEDELVVMMVEMVSTSHEMHFDVFEFDGEQLSWVEDFSPVSNLFELYDKLYGQQLYN